MSLSFSSRLHTLFVAPFLVKPEPHTKKRLVLMLIGIPLWVFLGFMASQLLVIVLLNVLQQVGVPLGRVNPSLLQVAAGGVVYALSLLVVIGGPRLVRLKTTRAELGIQRSPVWLDVGLVPFAAVLYFFLTTAIAIFAAFFLKFVNSDQVQDTGFSNLTSQTEYILAFIMLVVIAPIAEELLFRGYLLGKLRKYAPLWAAILITSVVFGIVHFAWNVGLDVFALSIALCLLRVVSKSIWPSMMLHMLKNSVAFFFLFIYPVVASTLGG